MTKEEAEKNREKWLEIAKPFADKKDKLNVRRDELLREMEQLQEDYIKAFPVKKMIKLWMKMAYRLDFQNISI